MTGPAKHDNVHVKVQNHVKTLIKKPLTELTSTPNRTLTNPNTKIEFLRSMSSEMMLGTNPTLLYVKLDEKY